MSTLFHLYGHSLLKNNIQSQFFLSQETWFLPILWYSPNTEAFFPWTCLLAGSSCYINLLTVIVIRGSFKIYGNYHTFCINLKNYRNFFNNWTNYFWLSGRDWQNFLGLAKQCRPWSDCSLGAVWSGSTQFAQAILPKYFRWLRK